MDEPESSFIATSPVAGAMNYPSTTQALFALIVMIIVLLFILVYCCWGTFTCTRQDDSSAPAEDGVGPNVQQNGRHILRGPHTVIVPINNMIYVGDPETHQIYQIPIERDKPPAYTEVFHGGPPPPYRTDIAASSASEVSGSTNREHGSGAVLPDTPPAYDDCVSATPSSGDSNPTTVSVECRSEQGSHDVLVSRPVVILLTPSSNDTTDSTTLPCPAETEPSQDVSTLTRQNVNPDQTLQAETEPSQEVSGLTRQDVSPVQTFPTETQVSSLQTITPVINSEASQMVQLK